MSYFKIYYYRVFHDISDQANSDLTFQLVDEMLDFYKNEITKFSIEYKTVDGDVDLLNALY